MIIKKFGLTLVLGVFIVASVSGWYGYTKVYASRLPDFKLELVRDSSVPTPNLRIDTVFTDALFTDPMRITTKGTVYESELSFYERNFGHTAFGTTDNAEWNKLHRTYPGFMRGISDSSGVYEDDGTVISVRKLGGRDNSGNFKLEIALLDKPSGKIKHYPVSVDGTDEDRYFYVFDVQYAAGQVVIYADLGPRDASETQHPQRSRDADVLEAHVLRFNPDAGRLTDEPFAAAAGAPAAEALFAPVMNGAGAVAFKAFRGGDRLYRYDQGSGQVAPVELPPAAASADYSMFQYGDRLFLFDSDDSGIRVWTVDLPTGRVGESWSVTAETLGMSKLRLAVYADDPYLYVFGPLDYTNNVAAVLDLVTGEVVRSAKLTFAGNADQAREALSRLQTFG